MAHGCGTVFILSGSATRRQSDFSLDYVEISVENLSFRSFQRLLRVRTDPGHRCGCTDHGLGQRNAVLLTGFSLRGRFWPKVQYSTVVRRRCRRLASWNHASTSGSDVIHAALGRHLHGPGSARFPHTLSSGARQYSAGNNPFGIARWLHSVLRNVAGQAIRYPTGEAGASQVRQATRSDRLLGSWQVTRESRVGPILMSDMQENQAAIGYK